VEDLIDNNENEYTIYYSNIAFTLP
jgi:hypothetical protein